MGTRSLFSTGILPTKFTPIGIEITTPVNTVAPVVSGNFFVGQTLSCSTGTWTGGGITYTYQWQNNTVDIGGATASTYTLVSGDDADSIRCVVTATNSAGAASANSNAIVAIRTLQWLDADNVASITQTSNSVSAQADLSGNGWNATQGTGANQPIWTANAVNSRYAILYDGTTDLLSISNSIGSSVLASDVTQFHVVHPVTLSGFPNAYWGTGSGTRFGFEFTSGVGVRGFSGNSTFAQASMGGTAPTGVSYIVAIRRATNALATYVNGSTFSGTATNGNGGTFTGISVGNTNFNGYHCESVVINRALSTAELNQVGNYLATKWGVTWANI